MQSVSYGHLNMVEKHIVKLKSFEEDIFQVDMAVVFKSQVIKNKINEEGIDFIMPIPLLNVSSDILSKVIEYCKYHLEEDQKSSHNQLTCLEDDINAWETEFVKIDLPTLFNLIKASDYLQIDDLLDLTCQTIANMITTKTPKDIRKICNLDNNFTIEEEDEEIRRESQLLTSTMEALPIELQRKIRIKVGQNFHNGMWSAWQYNGGTETLIVELGALYDACDMDQQIANILLHVDIGLVNTLVLQTCCIRSVAPHLSGGERVNWIDQLDLNLFKKLIDFIDMRKVKKMVMDNRSIPLDVEE